MRIVLPARLVATFDGAAGGPAVLLVGKPHPPCHRGVHLAGSALRTAGLVIGRQRFGVGTADLVRVTQGQPRGAVTLRRGEGAAA